MRWKRRCTTCRCSASSRTERRQLAARRDHDLRFRHPLEEHDLAPQNLQSVNDMLQAKGLMMKVGTVVDATLIAAPSSTKNRSGERDPEMHQTKKGNQWHFRHEGAHRRGRRLGLVHTVREHGGQQRQRRDARPTACCTARSPRCSATRATQGAAKRPDAKQDMNWHVAMRPGKRPR